MYGMLLESIQHFIKDIHGEEVWDEIRCLAGVENHAFITHQRYSDDIFHRLAEGAATVIGKDNGWKKEDFMRFFGTCFVKFFSNYGYDRIIKVFGRHLTDFLNGIDIIHEQMRFGYPKMQSPSFHCSEETSTGLTLHYKSRRNGFKNYVVGQIQQVAREFYNIPIEINIISATDTPFHCHVAYRLVFDNHAANPLAPDLLCPPLITDNPHKTIPISNFFSIFPFSCVISPNMRISMAGASLLSTLGSSILGLPITDTFVLRRPRTEFTWENLRSWRAAFELVSRIPTKLDRSAPSNIRNITNMCRGCPKCKHPTSCDYVANAEFTEENVETLCSEKTSTSVNGITNGTPVSWIRIVPRAQNGVCSVVERNRTKTSFSMRNENQSGVKSNKTSKPFEGVISSEKELDVSETADKRTRCVKKAHKGSIFSKFLDEYNCFSMPIAEVNEAHEEIPKMRKKSTNDQKPCEKSIEINYETANNNLKNGVIGHEMMTAKYENMEKDVTDSDKEEVWVKLQPKHRITMDRNAYVKYNSQVGIKRPAIVEIDILKNKLPETLNSSDNGRSATGNACVVTLQVNGGLNASCHTSVNTSSTSINSIDNSLNSHEHDMKGALKMAHRLHLGKEMKYNELKAPCHSAVHTSSTIDDSAEGSLNSHARDLKEAVKMEPRLHLQGEMKYDEPKASCHSPVPTSSTTDDSAEDSWNSHAHDMKELFKKEPRLHLKGEMKYIKQWDKVLFICSPMIGGFREMIRSGVYMSDLGIHDNSQEMVLSGIQPLQQLELARDRLSDRSRKLEENLKKLEQERLRSNELLYSMIPKQIAEQLKSGQDAINTCKHFESVTILFSYLDGFIQLCSKQPAIEVVGLVNNMFTLFDKLSEKHDVYKFETLGDAVYMAVSGAPEVKMRHAEPMAAMALDMIDSMGQIKNACANESLTITLGMHSGAVVGGVVGQKMPQYCLFGHSVNIASRLRTTSLPMRIHISESCNDCLQDTEFLTEFRGTILLKGIKGEMRTYWLIGKNKEEEQLCACAKNDLIDEGPVYMENLPPVE